VFGHQELNYYQRFKIGSRSHVIGELIAGGPPALIIAQGLETPPDILAICDEQNIPLFSTPLPAAQVIDFLRVYLSKKLAQRVIMHGVFMDVLGVGVLITGDSGLGKSELGLELISRSHGLVADDAVEFSRIAPNMIEGRCPPLLQNLLEVRGLGLLDIKAIFGETAVRRKMRLKLIVHLVKRGALDEEVERLPFHFPTEDVLGLPIRKVVIPVAAGRNIAVLLEAAVRNTILQLRGIDTLQEFMERQRAAISHEWGLTPCASYSSPVFRAPSKSVALNKCPGGSSGMRIVLITGISGSGKSVALNVLKTQATTASTTLLLPSRDGRRHRQQVARRGRRPQRRVAGRTAVHGQAHAARARPRRQGDVPDRQHPLAGGALFGNAAQPSAVARTAAGRKPGLAPHADRMHPGRARALSPSRSWAT
jgi:HPr kinase/phosphorylase